MWTVVGGVLRSRHLCASGVETNQNNKKKIKKYEYVMYVYPFGTFAGLYLKICTVSAGGHGQCTGAWLPGGSSDSDLAWR